MRIKSRANRRRNQRLALNMSSMIDCTFLLLAYFLLTVVIIQPEDQLSPNLRADRSAASGAASDFQPQIVDVQLLEAGPVYRLGEREFRDRDSLTAALTDLPKDAGLFVRVHAGPTVGFAAAAMQAGRDSGFDKVTYVPAGSGD